MFYKVLQNLSIKSQVIPVPRDCTKNGGGCFLDPSVAVTTMAQK